MSLVTNVHTKAELDAFARAHPNGWVVGIREYVRILPLQQFQQNPEGKRGTLVYCAPNGAPDRIEALARVWLTDPRGKKADGSYRLYYFPAPPPEVVTALERLGYWVYTVPGTVRPRGDGGLNGTPLFASREPDTEWIYGRRRPSQKICYIGRTGRYAARDREHSWRFGPTEAVPLEKVESRLAGTREREWIQKYDAKGVPLYNDTYRSPGAPRPKEPLVGTLLPLAEKKRWVGG